MPVCLSFLFVDDSTDLFNLFVLFTARSFQCLSVRSVVCLLVCGVRVFVFPCSRVSD